MTNILAQKAVLAALSVSQWTARKYDRKVSDEVNAQHNAQPDAGRYNKLLIGKEAIANIVKIAGEARLLHYELTLPWIDAGPRILPSAIYVDYANRFRKLKQDFDAAADQFYLGYEGYVEDARVRLNGMFDENDYPKPSQIRGKFAFEITILPLPDAGDFRIDIAQDHLVAMQEDVEAKLKGALDGAMQDAKDRIVKLVGNMAERLKAYTGGRDGFFKDSLVDNVRELAALLPSFNLKSDPAFDSIIQRIERDLCSEEPKTLRDDENVRKTVAADAEKILADVQNYMA